METDYKAYLSHRDAAHDKWKAYCEQWEIPFNWENFCLWAEEHLDGEGCLSLINTEEATLDEIRERSLTWQKMKSAISGEARWVVRHRAGLDFQKADDPAEEPKEAETDLSEILTEASEEEKAKESLMNAYDDLTSEGYELWSKHLKRFISWTGLYDAAQSNWPALADWSEYSPDDNSEESLKLQVAIWKNFKADLDYTIRVINNEGAERGEIWLLKLLAIKPEPTPAYTEKDLWDLRAEIHDLLDDGIDAQAPGLAQVHKIPLDVVKAEIAQAKASLAIAESKPDLDGLRNNLERMQGSNTKPNPSILSQAYDVPEDVVRSEIENYDFTDGREPQKPPTDKTFEPPPSTNRGIVFQAHNEARAAYDAMMGGEPAAKVADKYWESFLAEAKRNAPRGKGLPRGDNTGTGNPYEKSQAKHIVGAWQWIAEQCRPPVQQNKPTEAEQKLIGLGLLERQPAVCHPPRPDWLRGWVYDVACRMSDFNVVIHGLNYEGEIGRLEFQPSIPLDADDLERIVAATREAIDVEIQEILAEHEENQEASQPQLGFETVKYAMRGHMMRILLSGSLTHILEITEAYPHFRRYIGFLNTPRSYHSFERLKQYEYPICADNGAFKNFNPARWNTFIKSITPDIPLQWLSVPDRVEDMKETLRLYAKWRPSLVHVPRALVAQDGAEDCELPWSDFRCLFIGGSTEWKLSGAARDLIVEAQASRNGLTSEGSTATCGSGMLTI